VTRAPVLGVDPGTRKAGFAVLSADGHVMEQGIEAVEGLLERVRRLAAAHAVADVALGRGTNAAQLGSWFEQLGLPVHLVDERETTLRARTLYFADHPPRGWRRLIPLGLQLPPRPIDDYAAVLIARRFLQDRAKSGKDLPGASYL
jgi:RNase H-fold protein (predicted Holliday junction resolvase)